MAMYLNKFSCMQKLLGCTTVIVIACIILVGRSTKSSTIKFKLIALHYVSVFVLHYDSVLDYLHSLCCLSLLCLFLSVESLDQTAGQFKDTAGKLKSAFWLKNVKVRS